MFVLDGKPVITTTANCERVSKGTHSENGCTCELYSSTPFVRSASPFDTHPRNEVRPRIPSKATAAHSGVACLFLLVLGVAENFSQFQRTAI